MLITYNCLCYTVSMSIQKKWLVAGPIPNSFKQEHPELPKIILQLLWNRNLKTQQKIDEFLHPDYSKDIHDPFLFRDMRKTVDRLFKAIENKEKIVIHGDYDADGVSASVILANTLDVLGANTDIFIPHREKDGYGLNADTVEKFSAEDIKIIITCDCGISNTKEIARANKLGIDVIVTDHHQEPVNLPDALAIIHPKIEGETYPFKGLAGGGVAFKLAQGLLQTHAQSHETLQNGESHEAFEKWLLDLVAISSVADMVPLLGETRTLVRYGLIVLEKTKRPGLRQLMKASGILDREGKPRRAKLGATDIGFRIAPRINATGRMSHAKKALDLIMEQNEAAVKQMAEELNNTNRERQKMTEELAGQAREQVRQTNQQDDAVIVIAGDGWPAGLVGLIASKIKDEFYKPTFVVTKNKGWHVGSGRSTAEFNMFEGMQKISHCFEKFGGHPQACGFTLRQDSTVLQLKKALAHIVKKYASEEVIAPTIEIDSDVTLEDINWNLLDILERCEPFGIGNPEPRFTARGCEVVQVEPVGNGSKHLRLHVKHKTGVVRKTIGFNFGDWCDKLDIGDIIDLVFEAGINEWNGNRELQLKIVDLKKSSICHPERSGTKWSEVEGSREV